MRTLLLGMLALAAWQSPTLARAAEDELTCVGYITNVDQNVFKNVDLVRQSYDKNYMEGTIDNKTFGALVEDVPKVIYLLVAEPKVKRTAIMDAGFTKIPDSQVSYASQHYVVAESDGTQTWVETSCYLGPATAKSEARALAAKHGDEVRSAARAYFEHAARQQK